jgi:hypothetical protein
LQKKIVKLKMVKTLLAAAGLAPSLPRGTEVGEYVGGAIIASWDGYYQDDGPSKQGNPEEKKLCFNIILRNKPKTYSQK